MRRFLFIFLAILMTASAASAVVVSDTNILLRDGGSIADYAFFVYQNQAATDETWIWANVSGQTLSFGGKPFDEGSDWYLTSDGDSFTADTIQAGSFPTLVRDTPTGDDHNDLNVGNGDFYLGVNTGQVRPIGDTSHERDVYGWVHLQNDDGTLTMLGNAMAYGEGGIIIGTTQATPEPAGWMLLAFLAFPMLIRRSAASWRDKN